MEIGAGIFSDQALLWLGLLYGLTLANALRLAPWRRLARRETLNVFLGATVVLIGLWHMRAQAGPELAFHLLGVTTLTLMFGWSLALLSSALVLAAVTLNGRAEWEMFAVNSLLLAALPATISQFSLVLVRSLLPKNFFIFVLGNGFLTAGLAALVSGFLAVFLLGAADASSLARVQETYLPVLPLLALPEAFINGWAATVLVCFRPQWVYSFSDELYLKGK